MGRVFMVRKNLRRMYSSLTVRLREMGELARSLTVNLWIIQRAVSVSSQTFMNFVRFKTQFSMILATKSILYSFILMTRLNLSSEIRDASCLTHPI